MWNSKTEKAMQGKKEREQGPILGINKEGSPSINFKRKGVIRV